MDIAYYPGCTLKTSSSIYDVQCKIVMGELGINLKELDDWSCCGATSAAKTDDFLAIAMSARNLGLAEASGLSQIVIPCSACYNRLLVGQKNLKDNPTLKDEINSGLKHKVNGGIQVMSILEVLVPEARSGRLAEKIIKPLTGLNPACYYGCLQTRFPNNAAAADNVENPQGMETILRATGIKNPLDWNYKTDCCGASASINDPETAFSLMARIMNDAIARGANCFVVTCPLCQFNLDAHQEKFCITHGISRRLPVYFITELVGLGLGKTVKDLQIDRHIVDSVNLLKELNLI